MSDSPDANPASDLGEIRKPTCPKCHRTVAKHQVVCVPCGYHLKLEKYLPSADPTASKQPEEVPSLSPGPQEPGAYAAKESPQELKDATPEPADPANPFAPPTPLARQDAEPPKPATVDMDLELAHDLRFVVTEWKWVIFGVVCCLFGCAPIPVFMFPYYAYKAYLWQRLYAKHKNLHNPNSFAAYGTLAAEFKDSRYPILGGVAIGFSFWCLIAIVGLTLR